jgi:hypothetical protein
MGGDEAYTILVGKPEDRRPLGRPRSRRKDKIKTDLRGIGLEGEDWINLAKYRDRWRALVNTVINLKCRRSRCRICPNRTNGLSFSSLVPRVANREYTVLLWNPPRP